MKLIDADALIGELHKTYLYSDDARKVIYRKIENAPTIKPERKTGKWIEIANTNHTYVCSVCGRILLNITDGKNMVTKNYPFCHCGADMRGEQE